VKLLDPGGLIAFEPLPCAGRARRNEVRVEPVDLVIVLEDVARPAQHLLERTPRRRTLPWQVIGTDRGGEQGDENACSRRNGRHSAAILLLPRRPKISLAASGMFVPGP
jgi:hypothetical protein